MKNVILINIDTEREKPIIIGKPEEIKQPTTREEAGVMITTDISCVCEALCSLISMADLNVYAKKADMISLSIARLNELLKEESPTQPLSTIKEPTQLSSEEGNNTNS